MGPAASVLYEEIDESLFHRLAPDHFSPSLYNKLKSGNGKIAKSRFINFVENANDAFATHNWAVDKQGRNNHERVALLCRKLKEFLLRIWFDEEMLFGNINEQMADGIDNSAFVLFFITMEYMEKVAGKSKNGNKDNCRYEFMHATTSKDPKYFIVVVMEEECLDTKKWFGLVQASLSGILYVNFTKDSLLDSAVADIVSKMRSSAPMLVCERLENIERELLAKQSHALSAVSTQALVANKASTTFSEVDLERIACLTIWFNKEIAISSKFAQRYAETLVQNNIGNIEKLRRRLRSTPSFLSDLKIFEKDDIEDISSKLQLAVEPEVSIGDKWFRTAQSAWKNNRPLHFQDFKLGWDGGGGDGGVRPRAGWYKEIPFLALIEAKRITTAEILSVGFSNDELIALIPAIHKANLLPTFSDFKALKFKITEIPFLSLIEAKRITTAEILSVGLTNDELIALIPALHKSNLLPTFSDFKALKFKNTEIPFSMLIESKGISLSEIQSAGLSKEELSKTMYPLFLKYRLPQELFDCGSTLVELKDIGYTWICSKTWSGHTSSHSICDVIQLRDGNLCIGDDAGLIKVVNPFSGKCVRSLQGHTTIVYSLTELSDGSICSASWDKSIKVWNASDGKCVMTISNTNELSYVFQLRDGNICTCDNGNNIKIWKIAAPTAECIKTLVGHTDRVYCAIQLDDDSICSGSVDKTINIWKISSGEVVKTLSGHTAHVWRLKELSNKNICSASYDKTLRIWQVSSGQCIMTLSGHSGAVWAVVQLSNSNLCSCSDDGTLRVWDSSSGKLIKTMTGTGANVRSVIQLKDGSICSVGLDKNIRIWNFID